MKEIIPAIIAKDFDDLKKKIELVEPYTSAVQLDVMDGIFVPNKTWPFDSSRKAGFAQGKPSVTDLNAIKTNLFLEAHLMVEKPQEAAPDWLDSPVKRIIFHWEALEKIHAHEMIPYKTSSKPGFPVLDFAQEAHSRNVQLGVALNPDTPIGILDAFINDIDLVLLMSVKPGYAGQKFIEKVIPKITALRQRYRDVKIEVDGGINLGNAKQVAQAGADILVVGSAVFESNNIEKAFAEIKDSIKI